MEYSIKIGTLEAQRSDCLILGVFSDKRLSDHAAYVNQITDGQIKQCLDNGDIGTEVGQILLLPQAKKSAFSRIMLVSCGKSTSFNQAQFKRVTRKAIANLKTLNCREAINCLTTLKTSEGDEHWRLRQSVRISNDALYRFEQCKSDKTKKRALRKMVFLAKDAKQAKTMRPLLQQQQALGHGMQLTKDLGNLPGNICTPSYLAKQARSLARQFPALKVKILDEAAMKKLGMGALLSVNQGSIQPPKFIIMEYKGGKKSAEPIVLVGKGVTFDSGGISIKPSASMDEMKYDMCGAASVFGTLRAALELKLPINIVGIVGAVENMPSHKATKPGDIVTSMSGQTIEVLNTDAEGRLVLCDALTYCQRFKPDTIIDIATLTGAILISLGKEACGVFTEDDSLAKEIAAASDSSDDRSWRMPLWDEYHDSLDSNFADFSNCGDRLAGSCTAAAFLSKFTEGYRWAHVDIAGIAWHSGAAKGATGRPVPLLLEYLIQRSH